MKNEKTLVFAGLILSLTLSAFPHGAAASTGTTPSTPPVSACSSGKHITKVEIPIIVMGGLVLSLLNVL